jgi:N-acetylneuraminate synthase
MRTLVIAEVGVNHNGSIELAKKLIQKAAEAGADIVKFQTFSADQSVTRSAPKAEYQTKSGSSAESQYQMIKKLELSPEAHQELFKYCQQAKIEFLSTPFDLPSIDLLKSLSLKRLKVPSGEITNAPYLLKMAQTGLPLIVSTGMSNLQEIQSALGVLAYGLIGEKSAPSKSAFEEAFKSEKGQEALKANVTLLHCTSEYPAPLDGVNLLAIETLRSTFDLEVGYSDHTEGASASIAAVTLGASVIEKHLTLDRNAEGPDHRASMEPEQFKAMVTMIREVERALGSSHKEPSAGEEKNKLVARKSLVAAVAVKKGELFDEGNLACKRPGGGVSPLEYWDWIGKPASRDFAADEMVGN